MLSKKEQAIKLRREGKSLRDIEMNLGIARSTLSGWLKNIKLSKKQQEYLYQKWLQALVKARQKASQVHRKNRKNRMENIKKQVDIFTRNVDFNKELGEIIFAVFYEAEGTKKENSVTIANSNPALLKNLIHLFRYLYSPNESKFRCCLHLRADQNEERLKTFWSEVLNIPKAQFVKTQFDKRTTKPSFEQYKGVCVLMYFDINLQRRILSLGKSIFNKISQI